MHYYTLDFSRQNQHFIDITLSFVAQKGNPILWLPTWIAGSYLIREFAKHITSVSYSTQDGDPKRARKLTKNRWQLQANADEHIQVTYSVYCFDSSIRACFVDSERIFLNFSSLLLGIDGQKDSPCCIKLLLNKAFMHLNSSDKTPKTIACGLPYRIQDDGQDSTIGYIFDTLAFVDSDEQKDTKALTTFDSYDYPITIDHQDTINFAINHHAKIIPHVMYLSGSYVTDRPLLGKHLQSICQAYHDWLDFLPFNDYTFMTHATQKDYGGLEHINSTALIIPRDNLYNASGELSYAYLDFLSLCSHEYFHAWWVKSVRPDVMMTSDLQSEGYTTLLWIFEGFTSYVDDFMLLQSGIIDADTYLNLMAKQITRYLNNGGRDMQSLEESSFDAWIKLYRPDENSPNSTTSYYNKGMIVALLLDLLLIEHDARLFDVIKVCVAHANNENRLFGLSDSYFDTLMYQFLPKIVWDNFKADYIKGAKPVPLLTALACDNIHTELTKTVIPYGLKVSDHTRGLLINQVDNQASGAQAGLSVNDVIVAIEGLVADTALLARAKHYYKDRSCLQFHVLRGDRLLHFLVDNTQECPMLISKTVLSATNSQLLNRFTDKTQQSL